MNPGPLFYIGNRENSDELLTEMPTYTAALKIECNALILERIKYCGWIACVLRAAVLE